MDMKQSISHTTHSQVTSLGDIIDMHTLITHSCESSLLTACCACSLAGAYGSLNKNARAVIASTNGLVNALVPLLDAPVGLLIGFG